MSIHKLKIVPGSEAEEYFMQLLKEVNVKPESVMCRQADVTEAKAQSDGTGGINQGGEARQAPVHGF